MKPSDLILSGEVVLAKRDRQPIVALESTIFSELGLPSPVNREALNRVEATIRSRTAVPALTAIIGGQVHIGVGTGDHEIICGPTRKVAARDLGVAMAQRWPYGATTVSATVTLAATAGIPVFSTGGIGGVHRGWTETSDISADLPAIARHQVITVCAGAKVFLDLPATLEYLETLSVPVIGWGCDEFPAFHAPSSGLPLTVRADSADEVAAIARSHWELGGGGILLVAPVPRADGIPLEELNSLIDEALRLTESMHISGPAVTPAVLERLAELSGGRTVSANLALAENNASVAAQVATVLAGWESPAGLNRWSG